MMRRAVARGFKIFGVVYLIGGLLTCAWNVKVEAEHPEDYSNTKQFVAVMADQAIPLILFWPGVVGLEVGLRMGWICKSAEIGKC